MQCDCGKELPEGTEVVKFGRPFGGTTHVIALSCWKNGRHHCAITSLRLESNPRVATANAHFIDTERTGYHPHGDVPIREYF